MATAKNQELFPDFCNPDDLRVINDRCLLRTRDGHRVVIVSGIVLAQYAVTDRMAEAHAVVSLVEQGWADQNDVARGFRLRRSHSPTAATTFRGWRFGSLGA